MKLCFLKKNNQWGTKKKKIIIRSSFSIQFNGPTWKNSQLVKYWRLRDCRSAAFPKPQYLTSWEWNSEIDFKNNFGIFEMYLFTSTLFKFL